MSMPFSQPAGVVRPVAVGDGVLLHCLQWEGSRHRPPFLLVHGLASNCRTWEAVAGRLATAGHPVAAVDQRGHGQSQAPADGYDFATLCGDLERVLDALGWDRAVVVGQSTGGNIAIELARRSPDRLAGVAGVDGGVLELQEQWTRWEDCAAALAPPELEDTPVEQVVEWLRQRYPEWDDWGIDATLANLEVLDDGTVRPRLARAHHMALLRALWEHRPSTLLAGLEPAVMLVLADNGDDHAEQRRAEADRAGRLLRRGRTHWEKADHDVHVHRPGRVAELLLSGVEDGFWR